MRELLKHEVIWGISSARSACCSPIKVFVSISLIVSSNHITMLDTFLSCRDSWPGIITMISLYSVSHNKYQHLDCTEQAAAADRNILCSVSDALIECLSVLWTNCSSCGNPSISISTATKERGFSVGILNELHKRLELIQGCGFIAALRPYCYN